MKRSLRAASLMEVVVAITLFAVVAPLLFSLFPSALRALQQSETNQQVLALAAYRLDEARVACHGPGLQQLETRQLDGRTYKIFREYYAVDVYRMDVAVSVQGDKRPVQLFSRFLYGDGP